LFKEETAVRSTVENKKERKFIEVRRRHILKLLNHQDNVQVSDLATKLSVSEVTVRTDLNALAQRGLVVRAHGGAFRTGTTLLDRSLDEKEKLHAADKTAIAARAADFVKEGMSVILDSGSTTTRIARALKSKTSLTVITNALNIALEMKDAPGIQVIVIGGVLRENSCSAAGALANSVLDQLTADIFFLGVDGADPNLGFTTPDLDEACVNQRMIETAKEVIVVADPSKFGNRSLAVICKPEEVDRIITTSEVVPEMVREFELLGVEMVLV
jgi:DeoR family transcriptional regulator of aga operon